MSRATEYTRGLNIDSISQIEDLMAFCQNLDWSMHFVTDSAVLIWIFKCYILEIVGKLCLHSAFFVVHATCKLFGGNLFWTTTMEKLPPTFNKSRCMHKCLKKLTNLDACINLSVD